MEENSVAARLFALAKIFAGGKYSRLAEMAGARSGTFYPYMNGKSLPSAEILIKIRAVTGCDLNWLLTGEGEAPAQEDALPGRVAERLARYGDAAPKPAPFDKAHLAAVLAHVEQVRQSTGAALTAGDFAEIAAELYMLPRETATEVVKAMAGYAVNSKRRESSDG